MFISEGYAGRSSDKYITMNSGFLEALRPGDEVMADRGFTIRDLLHERRVNEHFLQGQKSDDPLSPDYVPSVFAHTKSPARRRAVQSLEKFKVRQNLKKKKLLLSSRSEAAMALPDFSSEMSEMTTQLTENDMPEGSIG
uniref:DDE Tnp4 domain-containing protein n=1 Tax=Knipowitschia caucasica TaxID=637954 RepID=A0AAV2MQM7_KNICA